MGIEPVRSFDDVIERANVYITDGSSTLYEFAAVGGPVVTLNPPFYRRDVHHGLRWWAHADVGVQCNEVELLNECVREAICDKEPQQRARKAAIQDVYPNLGTATDRAIEFLKDLAKNGCDNSSQN
jgi:UDP-N-acetylglucosamine:LPS N-acetylglucosamine transferase